MANHVYLFQKGIAGSTVTLAPPPGFRWRIVQLYAFIHAGGGAGTRTINFALYPGASSGADGAVYLGTTGAATGTTGLATAPTGATGASITVAALAYMPIFGHGWNLQLQTVTVAGDTWDWFMEAEEFLDGEVI